MAPPHQPCLLSEGSKGPTSAGISPSWRGEVHRACLTVPHQAASPKRLALSAPPALVMGQEFPGLAR